MCNHNCRQGRDCQCWHHTQQFAPYQQPPAMSKLAALCIAVALVASIAAVVIVVTMPIKVPA